MSVKVILDSVLPKEACAGDSLEIEGRNVDECLTEVVKRFPVLHEKVFSPIGELQGWIEIFVNGVHAYPENLGYPVEEGDEIEVRVFLPGG